MIYEFTVLGLSPNTLGAGLPRLEKALPDLYPSGRLLGCFTTEFGACNRIAILVGYDESAALMRDRAAQLDMADPYGCGDLLASIERSACRPPPFIPPVEPGSFGPWYEIRTYGLAWGAAAPTFAGWERMVPKRREISKLLVVMETLETVPHKLVHIWPYPSLDARVALRRRAIAEGAWPPLAKPGELVSMQTEMFAPAPFSPLQ